MAIIDLSILSTSGGIALFILVGLVLIKYAGFRDKIATALGFAVASAMFFILDASTKAGFWALAQFAKAQSALGMIFGIIAWILLLVSAVMVTVEMAKVK